MGGMFGDGDLGIQCSTCKYLEVEEAYYCARPGGPYNSAKKSYDDGGNQIIGYKADDINFPCCNGEWHEPYRPNGESDSTVYRKFNEDLTDPREG